MRDIFKQEGQAGLPSPSRLTPCHLSQRERLWRNRALYGLTGSFAVMPRALPLGELARKRLRGRARFPPCQSRQALTEGIFFYICLNIPSIPHFCQRCKGGKSAWNQGIVHIFYICLIFCPRTAHICMLCALRRGAGAISLCKDALVFGMEKPVYYGYGK